MFNKIRRKIREIIDSHHERRKFKENIHIIKRLATSSGSEHKIIIDCGFNRGIVATRLLKELGGFSLYGFEVQQDLEDCSQKLEQDFPDRNIEIYYLAVSDHDGVIHYYEPKKWGKNYKGGTTTQLAKVVNSEEYSEKLEAPSIDFAKWLYTTIPKDSFVFIKMDIEGAEYDVINHLIKSDAIDIIDVIAVEWHAHKFSEPTRSACQEVEKALKKYAQKNRLTVLDWY